MSASLRLMGQDLGETGLAVGIGKIEGAQDRDTHPFLALEVSAVVRHMPLEHEHRARARLDRIPAADIGVRIVAGPEPFADIGRIVELDLSRICAAPSARLGHLAFEGQGAFASQC